MAVYVQLLLLQYQQRASSKTLPPFHFCVLLLSEQQLQLLLA
jgi:hypothetical protein